MMWIWALLGGVLIMLGLLDIFFTVLNYEAFGFLSARLWRVGWIALRWLLGALPTSYRSFGLSLGAPLMVAGTLAFWLILEILGFGFLYYAGMNREQFSFSPGLAPSFWEALYLSALTLATLGYGDVTPTTPLYQAATTLESLIGFTILTLSISFILGLYQVRAQSDMLAVNLSDHAADSEDPKSILVPHFYQGTPRGIQNYLMTLYQQFVSLAQGLRRYSTGYYFHSREVRRSLPYTLDMVGGVVASLRWGLPADHVVTHNPTLPALITRFNHLTVYLEAHFISLEREEAPSSVPFQIFANALHGDPAASDPWVSDFIEMDRCMRQLACLETPPDPDEAYARYQAWLPFAVRTRRVARAVAMDLGYDPAAIARAPDDSRF